MEKRAGLIRGLGLSAIIAFSASCAPDVRPKERPTNSYQYRFSMLLIDGSIYSCFSEDLAYLPLKDGDRIVGMYAVLLNAYCPDTKLNQEIFERAQTHFEELPTLSGKFGSWAVTNQESYIHRGLPIPPPFSSDQ